MPTCDHPLAPGHEFDGYQIIRFLGPGGFGEVWLCHSASTGSYHALKFISTRDPELLAKEHHALTLYRSAASQLSDELSEWHLLVNHYL